MEYPIGNGCIGARAYSQPRVSSTSAKLHPSTSLNWFNLYIVQYGSFACKKRVCRLTFAFLDVLYSMLPSFSPPKGKPSPYVHCLSSIPTFHSLHTSAKKTAEKKLYVEVPTTKSLGISGKGAAGQRIRGQNSVNTS